MLRLTRSAALVALSLGTAGAFGTVACEAGPDAGRATTAAAPAAAAASSKDVVDTAVAAGKFKTLAAALQAAGLVDTLKGAGPFTVFAPTDEAFAKLPEGTVETLLKPENKEKLKSVLTYHVVPARAMSSDLQDGQSVPTVNGKTATVKIADGKVMVGEANVTQADVAASNGVIHVIDTVLMP